MLVLAVINLLCAIQCKVYGQEILNSVKEFPVNNGDRLVLGCVDRRLDQLQGNIDLSWGKDGVTIPSDDPRLNVAGNGTLLLDPVRQQDAGRYTCSVTADNFQSTSITTLSVIGNDPFNRATSAGSVTKTATTSITASTSRLAYLVITKSVTTSSVMIGSITPSSSTIASYTTGIVTTKQPTSNVVSGLQLQVEAILIGDKTTNISSVLTELANLTKPGNELKLNANELSSSVDILEKLVTFNSLENNTAITTPAEQGNILEVASNLLDEKNAETWSTLLESRENTIDVLLKTMDEFGSQVSSQLGGSINSTSFVLLSRNIAFRVDRLGRNETLHVNFAQHGATFFAPKSVFSDAPGSRVSTIVYKTLHNVFKLAEEGSGEEQKEERKPQTSGSSIISATVLPRPKFQLAKPVKLVFKRYNQSRKLLGKCVFWEIGQSQRTWLTHGCTRVDHESNSNVTTCECDHLTIFAVLVNKKPVQAQHQHYLEYISTIGCACSLLFLLLTFAVIVLCWRQVKSNRVIMLLNLCVAIAASCLLIILAGYAEKIEMLCTVTAVCLHYFLLCVFSWMLGHGVILYFLIIKVETQDNLKSRMKWIYALGWVFPLPIVAVSLVLTGTENYAANNCWLTKEYGIIYWTFVAPVALIVLINSILLIVLLHRINRAARFKESMTRVKHVKAWLRRSSMLLPLLGVTWSFGFLTFISSTVVFHYIFTIFNSLQGLFLFFNFCILDDVFREAIVAKLCKAVYPKENSNLHSRHELRGSTPAQTQIAVSNDKKIKASQQGGFHDFTNRRDSNRLKIKRQNWMKTSYL